METGMNLIPSIAMPAWTASFKVITSRCRNCHRSLALRHLSARKAGIKMHDYWYCSSRCFTIGGRAGDLAPPDAGNRARRPMSRACRWALI